MTGKDDDLTFKKDGADPASNRPSPSVIGLRFIGAMFAALGIGVPPPQPEDEFRYRRTGHGRKHVYPKRRNMKLVSKRVRRKHRRARKAA